MRKLVLFMHTSLDGFVAGPKGEMDWIKANDEIFDYAGQRTDAADTALYGRTTYEMMEAYWPTAADGPNPTRHAKEHSAWYNKVNKVVLSNTLTDDPTKKLHVINGDIPAQINELKKQDGGEIIIFGSPSASHTLMHHNLIDEYWLFVNPILLGEGVPLFKDISQITKLKLANNDGFDSGVVCLHYERI